MADFEELLARASNTAQDLAYLLNERDQERRRGGTAAELMGKIRGSFNQLERLCDRLEKAQREVEEAPARFKLSQREVAKRREDLRRVVNEKTRLRGLDRTFVSSNDRDSLLSSGDGKSYNRESENTRDLTTQQMVDRSQQEMKAQDEILDVMSRGLDNLKGMGVAIRDETTLQMKLLDDMENEVDTGNANLKRETERTAMVTADSKTCWLYAVICILLAVLIALVAVRYF